jgi:hypothetical protein
MASASNFGRPIAKLQGVISQNDDLKCTTVKAYNSQTETIKTTEFGRRIILKWFARKYGKRISNDSELWPMSRFGNMILNTVCNSVTR